MTTFFESIDSGDAVVVPPLRDVRYDVVHRSTFAGLGNFELRPLVLPDDAATVHSWVREEYANYWGMNGLDMTRVEAAYHEILAPRHVRAFIGLHRNRPAFLVETYRPVEDRIAEHYEAEPGDRGMHVLVAPPTRPIPGFSWAVFRTVMDHLFADPEADRVVVEPDARNVKIHALNWRAGFVPARTVVLPPTPTVPGKTALLSFCTRAAYVVARDQEAMR